MEAKNRIKRMKQVYIHDTHIISPLGFSVQENFDALLRGTSGVSVVKMPEPIGSIFTGKIEDEAFEKYFRMISGSFSGSRIEQLMIAALQSVIEKNPVTEDSLLIVSTTKGNIKALEQGNIGEAHLHQTAETIRNYFGFSKKPVVISNACVSGVMALSVATRMLQMNAVSDVFVVAADELIPFIVSGFQSFQAMSDEVCKPYDKNRNGVHIGEASAVVYVSSAERDIGI